MLCNMQYVNDCNFIYNNVFSTSHSVDFDRYMSKKLCYERVHEGGKKATPAKKVARFANLWC